MNLRSIILNIGSSCFVRCPGCYNHFTGSVMKGTRIENGHILAFTQKLKEMGYTKVTIGGGDPLSREKIIELLTGIKQQKLAINLDTVGTAFLGDADTIFFGSLPIKKLSANTFIKKVDIIGIPLDGSNNTVASIFRTGRKKLFDEQIEIIDLLVSGGARVCVNTVMHRGNHNDITKIFDVIQNKKIFKWQIFQFMPIGMFGHKNKDQFLINDSIFQEVREKMMTNSADFGIQFKSISDRTDHYLIVDDSGNAWLPTLNQDREILGNIRSSTDVNRICEFLVG